ncbi:hypothetical protein SDC9_112383 [bioreactor metagenome]|uniref:Uncharacterized protein n=1 Tax=bioreactor metagenome TaxID=1076179 RepID=A0A645BJU7_9ZZZZ
MWRLDVGHALIRIYATPIAPPTRVHLPEFALNAPYEVPNPAATHIFIDSDRRHAGVSGNPLALCLCRVLGGGAGHSVRPDAKVAIAAHATPQEPGGADHPGRLSVAGDFAVAGDHHLPGDRGQRHL